MQKRGEEQREEGADVRVSVWVGGLRHRKKWRDREKEPWAVFIQQLTLPSNVNTGQRMCRVVCRLLLLTLSNLANASQTVLKLQNVSDLNTVCMCVMSSANTSSEHIITLEFGKLRKHYNNLTIGILMPNAEIFFVNIKNWWKVKFKVHDPFFIFLKSYPTSFFNLRNLLSWWSPRLSL